MKIKLEKFEGPLSLLLKLIEKEEMDITEISLSKIADQYIEYIQKADDINPEEMADFLVVAARLLLIKSKALLPFLCQEEKEEIEEFEEQLRMYKEFLEASKGIEKIIGKKKFMFAREFNRKALLSNAEFFSPPKEITPSILFAVFQDVLGRLIPPEKMEEEKLDHKLSIEDKIKSIKDLLISRIKFSFSRLFSKSKNKTEIIVSFLAMLELEKQRELMIFQENLFEEIIITKIKN